MKKVLSLVLLSMFLVMISCDVEGEPVEYSKVCSAANEKKTIETSGYLDDGGSLFCSNTGGRMQCSFKLKNDLKDKKGFTADIATGGGANAMEKPERNYQKADLKVYGNLGQLIDLSKKVKITGEANFSDDPAYTSGPVCYVKVYKIEQ